MALILLIILFANNQLKKIHSQLFVLLKQSLSSAFHLLLTFFNLLLQFTAVLENIVPDVNADFLILDFFFQNLFIAPQDVLHHLKVRVVKGVFCVLLEMPLKLLSEGNLIILLSRLYLPFYFMS